MVDEVDPFAEGIRNSAETSRGTPQREPTREEDYDPFAAGRGVNTDREAARVEPQQESGPTFREYAEDFGNSTAQGLGKGAASIPGIPGDIRNMGDAIADKALSYAGSKMGFDPPKMAEMRTHFRDFLQNTDAGQFVQKAFPLATATQTMDLPTSSGILKKLDEAQPFYKPKYQPGQFAETAMEMVPATMLFPGGGIIGNAIKWGILPGVATEGAGQVAQSIAPETEPYVRALTAMVSTLGVAALDNPSQVARYLKQQMGPNANTGLIDRAAGQMAQNRADGVRTTWGEVLSQESGQPMLTNTQRILESDPRTRPRMEAFFQDRPAEIDRAARRTFDTVAPVDYNPSLVGSRTQEAAERSINDVRNSINTETRPFYDAASRERLAPNDWATLQGDASFTEAHQWIREHPELEPRFAHLADDSVGMADATKKLLEHRANIPIGENGNENFLRSMRGEAGTEAQNAATRSSPDYALALDTQATRRAAELDPLLAGPLGKIADTKVTKDAISALFPGKASKDLLANSEHEVGDAVARLAHHNPDAARQLVRIHLETVFNQATTDMLQGGAAQFGGAKFSNMISGNGQQMQNLRAAVEALPNGANVMEGVQRLLDLGSTVGQRMQKNSLTTFNVADREAMGGSNALIGTLKTASSPGTWWTIFGKKIGDWQLGRNMNEMARIMTDPNAAPLLRQIVRMPVGSEAAMRLAARIMLTADPGMRREISP